MLRFKSGKHFKRLKCTLKRQRTIFGILIRQVRAKMGAAATATTDPTINSQTAANPISATAGAMLTTTLERAERTRYEFGVKISLCDTIQRDRER